MRFLVLISMLISSVSFAEIKPHGTFVPYLCGESENQEQLCFGKTVGFKDQYVSITFANGAEEIFKVTRKTPINGGINPQFSAEKIQLKAENQKAVAVVRKKGLYATAVTVTLASGETLTFTNFEAVYTTL